MKCDYEEFCKRPCPEEYENCARFLAAGVVGIEKVPEEMATIEYWVIADFVKRFGATKPQG
jgi:hypothetical protein